jgi:hypothetical protein
MSFKASIQDAWQTANNMTRRQPAQIEIFYICKVSGCGAVVKKSQREEHLLNRHRIPAKAKFWKYFDRKVD